MIFWPLHAAARAKRNRVSVYPERGRCFSPSWEMLIDIESPMKDTKDVNFFSRFPDQIGYTVMAV